MHTSVLASIRYWAMLVWCFPLVLNAQTRVYEFTAAGALPPHAQKVLHTVVTDAFPGSQVSVQDERVKVRASHRVSGDQLLDLLTSTALGPFNPAGRPVKSVEKEEADGSHAAGTGPPPALTDD